MSSRLEIDRVGTFRISYRQLQSLATTITKLSTPEVGCGICRIPVPATPGCVVSSVHNHPMVLGFDVFLHHATFNKVPSNVRVPEVEAQECEVFLGRIEYWTPEQIAELQEQYQRIGSKT